MEISTYRTNLINSGWTQDSEHPNLYFKSVSPEAKEAMVNADKNRTFLSRLIALLD